MKDALLHDAGHQWLVFGRDDTKPPYIIDTNQYLVRDGARNVLLEPGGSVTFTSILTAVAQHVALDELTDLFASHQDPDVISSLGLWDRTIPDARLHAPWMWEGFLRHLGCHAIEYVPIPDEGGVLELESVSLRFVPAHYLHAPGNFHVYDPQARILMSGDVGAALEPPGAPMFVDDFEAHTSRMRFFHQRWMPSKAAKDDWVARARELDIDILAPQHGRLLRGDDVARFLDWLEALDVGIALGKGG